MVTGWDTGLCQDYNRGLALWFASRIDARWIIRRWFGDQTVKRVLNDSQAEAFLNALAHLNNVCAITASTTLLCNDDALLRVEWDVDGEVRVYKGGVNIARYTNLTSFKLYHDKL